MIAEREAGNVVIVIVKDIFHLGCDYLKMGYYTEIFLVERDMRYIAINDDVDSAKGDNAPFLKPVWGFYAKDTNEKVRAIKWVWGMEGKRLIKLPYSYTDTEQQFDEAEKDMKRKRCEVGRERKQIAELDWIFKRIYDDGINGTISHERFLKPVRRL